MVFNTLNYLKRVVLAVVLSFIASSLYADLEENIGNAVTWLTEMQNADGSWGQGEKQIEATFEVVHSLSQIKPDSAAVQSGINWILSRSALQADILSKKISVNSLLEQANDTWIDKLISMKNTAAGWGLRFGYSSNPLDTVLAYDALHSLHGFYYDKKLYWDYKRYWELLDMPTNAFHYLLSCSYISPEGLWSSVPGGETDLALTAKIISRISSYNKMLETMEDRDALIKIHETYTQQLNSCIENDGSVINNLYLSVLTYRALIRSESRSVNASKILNYITDQQNHNGSWLDDPLVTALAVTCLNDSVRTSKADIDAVRLVMDNTEQYSFGAYKQFEIVIDCTRKEEFQELLYLKIQGPDGSEYPVLVSGTEDTELRYFWNTKNSDPGLYTVTVEIADLDTGIKYDMYQKQFSIVPSAVVNVIKTYCDPAVLTGSEETTIPLQYKVITDIKSNTDLDLTFEYNFQDPENEILDQGSFRKTGTKGEKRESLSIGESSITFNKHGVYTLNVSVYQGQQLIAEQTGNMSFNTLSAFSVSKTLSPSQVPAVKGTKVHIKIEFQAE